MSAAPWSVAYLPPGRFPSGHSPLVPMAAATPLSVSMSWRAIAADNGLDMSHWRGPTYRYMVGFVLCTTFTTWVEGENFRWCVSSKEVNSQKVCSLPSLPAPVRSS